MTREEGCETGSQSVSGGERAKKQSLEQHSGAELQLKERLSTENWEYLISMY